MTYNSCMNDTKLTIANALLSLLKTQSLNKITVTQITKEANLTRQTFYRNFEDKEDLLGCIAESWVDVILRKLTEAFRVSDGSYYESMKLWMSQALVSRLLSEARTLRSNPKWIRWRKQSKMRLQFYNIRMLIIQRLIKPLPRQMF